MKIGFDAKWFFSGNPSGKVVVRNILKQLLIKYPEHNYYIFLKSKEKHLVFPYKAPNIHLVYVWGKPNLISNVLMIPLRTLFLKLDVCLFQYSAPPISFFKRIVYLHDVIFEDSPQYFSLWERIYYFPLRLLAWRAHRILTVSESEKKRIILHEYGRKDNVDVISNGVDSKFQPRELHKKDVLQKTKAEYKLPEQFLLYLGRLNERKNLKNLLRAISFLQNKTIPLILAGTFQWKTFDLPKEICDIGIKDRVFLPGFIKDELISPLYSLATIFCYVSYDEGFGLPPLEAMASGVPVVVANTGSLPEICAEAGNYVDPHNPQEIANMIDNLLVDEDLYRRKKEIGMQRANKFTWQKSAESLYRCIENTIRK